MIRLTGGVYNGRTLKTPVSWKTRPSQAKLRQALFNSIQMVTSQARVLDLFAGAGGLGFEALSRGADHVVFVDSDGIACQCILDNAKSLGLEAQITLIKGKVESSLDQVQAQGPFEIILMDPPYAGGWEVRLLREWPWDVLLVPGGRLVLEWGALKSQATELPEQISAGKASLIKVREKKYSESILTTFLRDEK